ncbi:MAG: hypothetical protein KatS3mg051_2086 [Anaerolineae bacterium]|nr:MAG: hypothetical protein KatS3mg051_2086 [Anaerolineae bacterium]
MYHNQSPYDSVPYSLLRDRGLRLSEHFRLSEFACADGSQVLLVHPRLVLLLEELRSALGHRPITITSGWRSGAYNAQIGGAERSYHLVGMAADIKVRGLAPSEVAAAAEELDAGGIGIYSTWVHVDVGPEGRRWRG